MSFIEKSERLKRLPPYLFKEIDMKKAEVIFEEAVVFVKAVSDYLLQKDNLLEISITDNFRCQLKNRFSAIDLLSHYDYELTERNIVEQSSSQLASFE